MTHSEIKKIMSEEYGLDYLLSDMNEKFDDIKFVKHFPVSITERKRFEENNRRLSVTLTVEEMNFIFTSMFYYDSEADWTEDHERVSTSLSRKLRRDLAV